MCAAHGEFREQDGQAVFCLREAYGRVADHSRAQQQWQARAPPEYEEYPVRMAWRQAEPIDGYGEGTYARHHHEAGMILLAKWGFLTTAFPAHWDQESSRADHGDAETVDRLDK